MTQKTSSLSSLESTPVKEQEKTGSRRGTKTGTSSSAPKSAANMASTVQSIGITRLTSNLILLGMFGVWGFLSVKGDMLLPVSTQFVLIAGILASGDIISGIQRLIKK